MGKIVNLMKSAKRALYKVTTEKISNSYCKKNFVRYLQGDHNLSINTENIMNFVTLLDKKN